MSWEQHVTYLTYFANHARRTSQTGPFLAYALLSTIPKNNLRLMNTPLSKPKLSYLEIVKDISKDTIFAIPVRSTPNSEAGNRKREASDYFTDRDLSALHTLVSTKEGMFRGHQMGLLDRILSSTPKQRTKMVITPELDRKLASELWTVIQFTLETLSTAYSKVPKRGGVAAEVLREVWKVVEPAFMFLRYALHQSKWLSWLINTHAAEAIAEEIRKNLKVNGAVPASFNPVVEGDGEEMTEIEESFPLSKTTPYLAARVYSWLKLVCSPIVQADTVLEYLHHFGSLEVDILNVPDVGTECEGWEAAIKKAYKNCCLLHEMSESLADTKAEIVIDKIKNVKENGEKSDKDWLKILNDAVWAFKGAVHCETALAAEYLRIMMSTTGSDEVC